MIDHDWKPARENWQRCARCSVERFVLDSPADNMVRDPATDAPILCRGWTLKHTRSDRPVVAEYLCPVHGRFALEVARDANGDPPAEAACEALGDCEFCGSGCENRPRCGAPSPFAISAPGTTRVKHFEVVRGKWEKPERSTYFDTRKLGEGQPLEEFRAERAKMWEEKRWAENKELLK